MSEQGTGAEFIAPHNDEYTEVIQPTPVNKVEGTPVNSDWWSLASCKGMVDRYIIFFSNDEATQALAKQICAGCVVIEECLEYALSTNQNYGTWGGATEEERRRMIGVPARRRRRRK